MNGGSFHELELALEALAPPEGLPEALAGVLELSLEPDDDALTRVVRALGSRSVLLVLAGFEGLVGDAAVLEHLLAACPGLKLLVTTRGRLNFEAEWVYPLGGLGTPPAGVALTDALGFDAVRLFVGRAKRARLGFALTSGDLPAVLQIRTRVQGSPLGIELAAG